MMLNLFSRKMPTRRAVLTVVLVLVISYSAFLVGNTMIRSSRESHIGDIEVYWDTTEFSGSASAVTTVAATANTASMAAADAATAARGASSPLFLMFDVAAVTGKGFETDLESDVEDYSAGRMVVYTAYVGLKVEDVDVSLDEIKLISVHHGGYVSEVNTRDDRGSVTLRVPQSRFHDAISDLEELGEVTTRDLMGEDVSEEYVDLEAQLATLQHQEARLFEIMEMGTTVESVLKVERELERVRGRIESIQGRLKFLDNRVDLSTITISLREEIEEVEVLQAWFPSVDWAMSVRTGLAVLVTVAQGMLTMTIILGPFIALGYCGVRLVRWYRAGKIVLPTPEEEVALS